MKYQNLYDKLIEHAPYLTSGVADEHTLTENSELNLPERLDKNGDPLVFGGSITGVSDTVTADPYLAYSTAYTESLNEEHWPVCLLGAAEFFGDTNLSTFLPLRRTVAAYDRDNIRLARKSTLWLESVRTDLGDERSARGEILTRLKRERVAGMAPTARAFRSWLQCVDMQVEINGFCNVWPDMPDVVGDILSRGAQSA